MATMVRWDPTAQLERMQTELVFGRFERGMRLPENVKDEDIRASFKDGVLTVKASRRIVVATP